MESNARATKAFILSMGSPLAMVLATAPIERVKLMLQCQHEMVISGRLNRPYGGFFDCLKVTRANEGVLSLWRGSGVYLLSQTASGVLGFALKESFKNLSVLKVKPEDSRMEMLTKNIVRGSSAGVVSFFLIYSLDYCRTRLACDVLSSADGATRQYRGMLDVYRQTMASDGVAGLHRGFVVGCVSLGVYRGLYFGVYDTFRPMFYENTNEKHNGTSLLFRGMALGACTALVSSALTYPIDTVRRRMMMRSGEPIKYKGSIDCARYILKNEGFMSFMNGFGTGLFKSFAGTVLMFIFDYYYRPIVDAIASRD